MSGNFSGDSQRDNQIDGNEHKVYPYEITFTIKRYNKGTSSTYKYRSTPFRCEEYTKKIIDTKIMRHLEKEMLNMEKYFGIVDTLRDTKSFIRKDNKKHTYTTYDNAGTSYKIIFDKNILQIYANDKLLKEYKIFTGHWYGYDISYDKHDSMHILVELFEGKYVYIGDKLCSINLPKENIIDFYYYRESENDDYKCVLIGEMNNYLVTPWKLYTIRKEETDESLISIAIDGYYNGDSRNSDKQYKIVYNKSHMPK